MKDLEKTTKTKIYNLIVLDKSGSMIDIAKEAVDGCNETIGSILAAQKKHADTQEHFISIALFCGCGVEMLLDCTPVAEAKKIDFSDYVPCCTTPLYDAIGQSVQKIRSLVEKEEDATALVTIITDGYENASKEWNAVTISKLIDKLKSEGWMFSFIGAGKEIVEVADTLSITNTVVWKKTSKGTHDVFMHENSAREAMYDKIAEAPCATAEERKRMYFRFSQEYYDGDKK